MEVSINFLKQGSTEKDNLELSEKVFGCGFNESLVHQVVVAYQAGGRAGTHSQKTRAEVRGGGRKPWKQKGTGRARAGTIRSPLWRGGGVTFAAKPRDYSHKVNKKMYRKALCSILSRLLRDDRLKVFDDFKLALHKTSGLIKLLGRLNLKNVLVIVTDVDNNLYLAGRNIPNFDVRDVQGIDPVSLIKFEQVIITVPAIKHLEEWLL